MNASSPYRVGPGSARVPVLLSVPHAGRAYGARLLALSRHPVSTLALLEDPFVDRLIDGGIAKGAAAIVATAPRAEIDLNRAPDDLDPQMLVEAPVPSRPPSTRAMAGLGLIPSRLGGHGALWRRRLPGEEVQRRLADVYEPYHRAIVDALSQLRQSFGVAVLLDCHSMPARGAEYPPVVLGDVHGLTCAPWLVAAAAEACAAASLPTIRNDPYAGGEIVRRHGDPSNNVHALQIEFDRGLYMASAATLDLSAARRLSILIGQIVASAAQNAAATTIRLAAE